ncbi:MAG TPA: sugar kinase, partial [Trebonia sp.]|nr:sugar kinase [Trebonia sp.]
LGGSLELSVAGAEANVAIGLARLGHQAGWGGRVGADELGELIRRTLRAEGVDISGVLTDPSRPTGLMLAERRIGDLVRVMYYRAGSAGSQLSAADVLPALDEDVRLLHLTGITAALSPAARECVTQVAARTRETGTALSVDVNYRSRLWTPAEARQALLPLVSRADIVFGSTDELAMLAGHSDPAVAAREILARGAGQVVVKRGADGATAHAAGASFSAQAKPVPVVDVVGAGDAFVAGYLSAYLDGETIEQCLERATVTAAFGISRRGDWEGLPTRAELSLLDLPEGTTVR